MMHGTMSLKKILRHVFRTGLYLPNFRYMIAWPFSGKCVTRWVHPMKYTVMISLREEMFTVAAACGSRLDR